MKCRFYVYVVYPREPYQVFQPKVFSSRKRAEFYLKDKQTLELGLVIHRVEVY